MAKKRKYRRSEKERCDHERAVTLRKMPDSQLVAHFDRQYQAGFEAGCIAVDGRILVDDMIKILESVKGVEPSLLTKIQTALELNKGYENIKAVH
jgi:hypothetical protein